MVTLMLRMSRADYRTRGREKRKRTWCSAVVYFETPNLDRQALVSGSSGSQRPRDGMASDYWSFPASWNFLPRKLLSTVAPSQLEAMLTDEVEAKQKINRMEPIDSTNLTAPDLACIF